MTYIGQQRVTDGVLERWDGKTWVTLGVAAGEVELDFGPFPGKSDASVVVTGQAGILATSIVQATVRPKATTDHSADEHLIETLEVFAGNIVPGTGFTIYGVNRGTGDTRLYGKWWVGWMWN